MRLAVPLQSLMLGVWNCRCRYYSMYGHIETLAKEIKKGAESVEGVEASLYQVKHSWWLLLLLFSVVSTQCSLYSRALSGLFFHRRSDSSQVFM